MSILNESLAGRLSDFGRTSSVQATESTAPENNLSYVRGSTHLPLRYMTIPQLLREAVSLFGPREAIVCPQQDIRLSYYEFDRAVDELASGFLAMGLQKGDRIGIWSPNCYEWVPDPVRHRAHRAMLVNINPAYRLFRAGICPQQGGCKAHRDRACVQEQSLSRDAARRWRPRWNDCEPGRLRADKLPHLRTVIVHGEESEPRPVQSFDRVRTLGGPAQQLRLRSGDRGRTRRRMTRSTSSSPLARQATPRAPR
jgi:fatty-acyl-CoA synthase